VLLAPTQLAATSKSSAEIDLSWRDTNSQESGYLIERSLDPTSGFAQIAAVGINVQSYKNLGLTQKTTYYYRVRAFGSTDPASGVTDLFSAYSSIAGATTAADTSSPSVPSGLKAWANSCDQIGLSWNASTDGASGIKGYNVYRGGVFLKQVLAPATSTADSGLLASVTYTYAVSAVDNAGNQSNKSGNVNVKTSVCPVTTTSTSTTTSTTTTSSTTTTLDPPTTTTTTLPATTTSTTTTSTTVAPTTTTDPPTTTTSTSTTTDPPTTSTSTTAPTTSTTSTAPPTTTTESPTTTTTTSSTTTSTTLANRPPVAGAGPDQATQTLTTITFDGSGSFDPDGTIVSRAWSFGDGASASGVTVPHAYAHAGTYTVTLTVTDDGGLTASSRATVTVANRPPVADGGTEQTTCVGATVMLDGSRSSDPDGTISSYAWSFGDGTSATGAIADHVYAAPGTYTPTLSVTDDLGATGTATALVDVAPAGGAFRWATRFGATGSDLGQAVAVDGSGNVVVAGYFTGTADFGGGPVAAIGSYDLFVAKYTASGAYVWARHFGGTGLVVGQGVAVDAAGNVAVTGYFTGTADFGGGPATSAGSYDIFVAKLAAADGAPLWSKRFGSANDDIGYAVAVDGGGNLLVTGYFRGTVDFGGATLVSMYGGINVFVAKLAGADGALVWSRGFWNTSASIGYGIAADGAGNVVVTGSFSGRINFGGLDLTSAGGHDVFLVSLSPDGTHLWSKRFGGTDFDRGYAVAADRSGDIAVAGLFTYTADFGGGPLTSAGSSDIFVAKFAGADGAHLWSKRFGSTSIDRGFGVAVDEGGNVAATGFFQGAVDFGGGPLVSAGSYDIFVAKLAATDGAPLWSKRFGSASDDIGYAVAMDAAGDVVATGYFQGTVDFGAGPLTSAGAQDAFVLSLGP